MLYKYETHLHTSEVSACAVSGAREMVHAFGKAGYAGIVVTDHFITERRNIAENWTWEQKMRFLHSGYEQAAAEGERLGLRVFFGWEMPGPRGEDYLTYNLPLPFLINHPEIERMPFYDYSRLVRASGGLLVRAHPFRQCSYIPPNPTVDEKLIDGVEVNNGQRDDPEQNNGEAWAWALIHPELIRTAGTDIHDIRYAGLSGMAFSEQFPTMDQMAQAMRRHEGLLIVEGNILDQAGNSPDAAYTAEGGTYA